VNTHVADSKTSRDGSYILLRRVAYTATALSFALIVLGGIVRITGSGMGCGDDWPRCNGEWFPPLDFPTFVEIFHRWVAALVSIAVLATAAVAWWRHRRDRPLVLPATLGAVLLVSQVLLGAVTVKLELPPGVVIVHFVNALLLLTAVLVTALRARPPGGATGAASGARHPAHGLAWITALVGFGVVILGAYVANLDAGPACLGFPFCRGGVLPPAGALGLVHWIHRVVAFGFLALVLILLIKTRKPRDVSFRNLRLSIAVAAGLSLVQIGIAAAMVLQLFPPSLRGLHLLAGTAVWAMLVTLLHYSAGTAESPDKTERTATP
jgi:heme A synthase